MALSPKLPWELANPKWAAEINPVLALPILAGNQIDNITLVASTPKVINHLLARMPQGWFLVDKNANANIWRTTTWTTTTVTLESSANAIISLYIY